LHGEALWFTGDGTVDTALVVARTADERIVRAVVDVPAPGLQFSPLELLAVRGSATGSLRFGGVTVPERRVIAVEPHAGWADGDGLWRNGALGLGLAARCLSELDDERLAARLVTLRDELASADMDGIGSVRARIAAFALQAAGIELAAAGSPGCSPPPPGHAATARRASC